MHNISDKTQRNIFKIVKILHHQAEYRLSKYPFDILLMAAQRRRVLKSSPMLFGSLMVF